MSQGKPRRLPSMQPPTQPYIGAEPHIASQPSANPVPQYPVPMAAPSPQESQDPRLLQSGSPYHDPRFHVPEMPEPESLPELGYGGVIEVTAWTTVFPGNMIFSYTTIPGFNLQVGYPANNPDIQGTRNSNVVINTVDLPDNLVQQLVTYWDKVEQLMSDVPHIATAYHDATLQMIMHLFGDESPLR